MTELKEHKMFKESEKGSTRELVTKGSQECQYLCKQIQITKIESIYQSPNT